MSSSVHYARAGELRPRIASIVVDLGIVTESQRSKGGHWSRSHKQVKRCRELAMLMLGQVDTHWRPGIRHVVLTRISPGTLDDDNLRTVLKPFRDQVAAWLAGDNTTRGRGDDSPNARVQYGYEQVKKRAYGVRIELQL